MTSTWTGQYMERAKKALGSKQRHYMTMEHQRGGAYISNQVRKHACHLTSKHYTHIFIRYRKILKKKKSSTRLKEKKRIIELIIKENHCCDLGTERKMRRTLPLGNFQKKKKEERSKKQVQTLPIGWTFVGRSPVKIYQCDCEGRSPMKIDRVSV